MSEDPVTSIFGPRGHILIKPNWLVRRADIWLIKQTGCLPAPV